MEPRDKAVIARALRRAADKPPEPANLMVNYSEPATLGDLVMVVQDRIDRALRMVADELDNNT